jgi:hypothetical protein
MGGTERPSQAGGHGGEPPTDGRSGNQDNDDEPVGDGGRRPAQEPITAESRTAEGPDTEGPTTEGPTTEGPTTEGPTTEGAGLRPVEELIAIALADTDPDGPVRWQAITALQERGDIETFMVARRLCASFDTAERVLGTDILGELGRDRPFTDRTLPVLRYLAASETDIRVLYSVLIAFGHLSDRRALPSVIELAGHEHPTVRYGAAYALPHVLGDPPDPTGLAALRRLAQDADGDVADWASLGLTLGDRDNRGDRDNLGNGASAAGGELDDLGGQVLDP